MEGFPERVSRPTLNTNTPERKDEVPGQREVPPVRRVSDEPKGRGLKGKKYIKKVLLAVVGLAIVLGLVWWFLLRNIGIPSYIETDKYQVACLQSGECYFGKVTSVTNDVIIIKDVFYVQKSTQTATDTKTTTASTNNLELIKLGNEVHGPEDMMVLTRSQVLYVENLKSDGKVTQTIQTYHQQNK